MNGHRDMYPFGTQLILELLLAHQAMGRDLEEVIKYLQRALAQQLKKEQENG